MRDFSAVMTRARVAVIDLAASVLGVRDALPAFATAQRSQLQTLANTVNGSLGTLDNAQSTVDTFVSTLDADMEQVKDLISEYFLRFATAYAGLVLSGVLVLGITLLPLGICVPLYKCGIFSNLALLVLVWMAAAVTMPMAALMSDICIEPGPSRSIVNLVQGTGDTSTVATLEYYLLCEDKRSASDPNFNPPGAYGSIVAFSRASNAMTQQVFTARADIENDATLAPFAATQPLRGALDGMVAQAYSMSNITQELVELGSCTSIGGRTYRPVVKALCEEVVGAGIAQFWAVHIAMGVFMLLLMGTGVWFCHGVRHPGGEKNRLAAAKHLRAEQLKAAAANGYGNGYGTQHINPVGEGLKEVEMPPMGGVPPPTAPLMQQQQQYSGYPSPTHESAYPKQV